MSKLSDYKQRVVPVKHCAECGTKKMRKVKEYYVFYNYSGWNPRGEWVRQVDKSYHFPSKKAFYQYCVGQTILCIGRVEKTLKKYKVDLKKYKKKVKEEKA